MGVLAEPLLDESRLTRTLFSYDASLYRVVPRRWRSRETWTSWWVCSTARGLTGLR